MARKAKRAPTFAPLDPLWEYPEMMSAKDIAEFSGISESSALLWIQRNGGVILIKGQKRNGWKVHKEYVRRAFNLPPITA